MSVQGLSRKIEDNSVKMESADFTLLEKVATRFPNLDPTSFCDDDGKTTYIFTCLSTSSAAALANDITEIAIPLSQEPTIPALRAVCTVREMTKLDRFGEEKKYDEYHVIIQGTPATLEAMRKKGMPCVSDKPIIPCKTPEGAQAVANRINTWLEENADTSPSDVSVINTVTHNDMTISLEKVQAAEQPTLWRVTRTAPGLVENRNFKCQGDALSAFHQSSSALIPSLQTRRGGPPPLDKKS